MYKKNFLLLTIVMFSLSIAQQSSTHERNAMEKAYTVVAVLQAKPEKAEELKQELIKVIEPSRAETACLEYRLHQDLNDPTQFVLYENWHSKEEHANQFQKPYIIAFAQKAGDWLAKPYQVICAQEID